jgi:hypothetical protein
MKKTAETDIPPMGAVFAALADEYSKKCTPEQNAIRQQNGRLPNVSGYIPFPTYNSDQKTADRHDADFPLARHQRAQKRE